MLNRQKFDRRILLRHPRVVARECKRIRPQVVERFRHGRTNAAVAVIVVLNHKCPAITNVIEQAFCAARRSGRTE